MDSGWVCLYRELKYWEWYKTPFMVHLFIHLIISANHQDGAWQGIAVKRGQLVTGRKSLSEETGISEQTVRTCLKRLEKTCEIAQQSTSKFTIITVCNYDKYQKSISKINQQITNNQPSANQVLTTNNNETIKEERKDIVEQPPRQREIIPFSAIISLLNKNSGKDFKSETKSTRSHIKARWVEGFRLNDFSAVIEDKCAIWKTDMKMCKYLRPETLFGTKFESYLQDAKNGNSAAIPVAGFNCNICDYKVNHGTNCWREGRETCSAFRSIQP